VHQLLTLASIIEREAVERDEMRTISAVFWNRLKINMPLQADPTVQYATGKERRALTRADLAMDHPFNTYRRPGLPPGPIASPGLAAIEAALDPAPVKYLYFVAMDDHRHYFSASLGEHNAAMSRSFIARFTERGRAGTGRRPRCARRAKPRSSDDDRPSRRSTGTSRAPGRGPLRSRRGRAGDRPRRQAGPAVRVEGMVHRQIGAGKRSPLLAGRVLNGGVGLQRHVDLSRFQNTAEIVPHLVALDAFALDDRGQRQELMHGEAARLGASGQIGSDLGPETLHHAVSGSPRSSYRATS